jgi:hypothetical protein
MVGVQYVVVRIFRLKLASIYPFQETPPEAATR